MCQKILGHRRPKKIWIHKNKIQKSWLIENKSQLKIGCGFCRILLENNSQLTYPQAVDNIFRHCGYVDNFLSKKSSWQNENFVIQFGRALAPGKTDRNVNTKISTAKFDIFRHFQNFPKWERLSVEKHLQLRMIFIWESFSFDIICKWEWLSVTRWDRIRPSNCQKIQKI